jgi:beta-ketoacyl synthase-like protein
MTRTVLTVGAGYNRFVQPIAVIGVGHVTNDAGLRLERVPRLARMDRYTRLALAATDAAVRDAGLDPATWNRERVAVLVASTLGCYESNAEFRASLQAGEPSPRAFAATLPSTPAGEIAIAFRAAGPQLAFAQGRGSELLALAEARRLIAADRADLAIVVRTDAAPADLRALAGEDGATAWMVARHAEKPAILGGGNAFGDDARGRAAKAALEEAGDYEIAGLHRLCAEDPLGAATVLIVQHRIPHAPSDE